MSKQTFGNDDNGVFHTGKGKPLGVDKEEGLGYQSTPPEKMDEYFELTQKCTVGGDDSFLAYVISIQSELLLRAKMFIKEKKTPEPLIDALEDSEVLLL
ncbi:MAG: hypothetical protein ABIN94_02615 [Ferruginibacter sp.]